MPEVAPSVTSDSPCASAKFTEAPEAGRPPLVTENVAVAVPGRFCPAFAAPETIT